MLKHFLLILFFFILIFVFFYFFQRFFIYFPSKEKPDPHHYHAGDMQVIEITVPDGFKISSWYKPALPQKPTVLYMHGNAGHIGYRISFVRHFLSAGFGVLLLEYRGYGGNPGRPTEAGLYQDARAAMDFLRKQDIAEHHIVLYGESLGTGIATQLATEFSICALVLQSPYTSFTDLARYHYYGIPMPIIDKYDSLSRIQKIHAPLLIGHGKLDYIVPYAQGLTLFNQANEPKQWVEFAMRGHNNLWSADFAQTIIYFIETHCN